ncbi:MAG: SoxR reducing system RseC family protein [Proteobacteria bacterium]|nr:SoxR reducing system RseC family protein [Pseudomonadota bacterium]
MIEEQAQVIAVEDGQLILQAQTQSACGSCSAKNGCGTSLLSKVVGRKFSRFQASNDINAKVGDTVVVGLSEDALLKGSLVMYLIPIISMLGFALITDFLLQGGAVGQGSAESRDLSIALSAVFGLLAGAGLAKWYFSRQSNKQQFSPVVLRKIIEHGKL